MSFASTADDMATSHPGAVVNHVEDGTSTPNSQARSESSSVSLLLHAIASLTCNETNGKEYPGLESSGYRSVSQKLENIQPPNTRVGSSSKNTKLDHDISPESKNGIDIHGELLAKLAQHSKLLVGRLSPPGTMDNSSGNFDTDRASRAPSARLSHSSGQGLSSIGNSNQEIEQLKKELIAAKETIAKQDEELHKTRDSKHILGSAFPTARVDPFKHNHFHAISARQDLMEDAKSDVSDSMSSFSRGINAWDSVSQTGVNPAAQPSIWGLGSNKPWVSRGMSTFPQVVMPQTTARGYPGLNPQPASGNSRFFGNANQLHLGNLHQSRTNVGNRGRSGTNPWASNWSSTEHAGVMGVNPLPYQPMGGFQAPAQMFVPRSNTPSALSAMAPEFNLDGGQSSYVTSMSSGQSYVPTVEPLNYRKLLDRSVSCNWKYIVDKIVCNNDQQASIFLQQKLKVGTAEQKFEIVQAIVAQAYPLMVNRFGNFLVQRCFEHGTPEQVVAIANTIRGNTLVLSMDAFGCHVIQKAFDAVPEEYKALMVHELLRRIPETVIHRYACHVWQKLFELRWSDSPPQIMKYVNEALRGMWHEVALGETGSLVVQNIFENCLEEDKRPCVDEVLGSIDIVAHGQFGNWCIQHVCEHGAPADKTRAIDHVLRYATEYSMDQFASKVIEKCLKIGANNFLDRYLERVCEGRPDRPRIPLIDIASDQYGNYLIQYILTNAGAQHREIVAGHIRKHMVSLRGSKFGSRVGLLCCNPAYATRPTSATTASGSRFPGVNNTIAASVLNSGTGPHYNSAAIR